MKEGQFRSSDAVTSISFLWLVIALPQESHSREIRSKNKSLWPEYSGAASSHSSAPAARRSRNNATTGQIWHFYTEYCWFSGVFCGGSCETFPEWLHEYFGNLYILQCISSCSLEFNSEPLCLPMPLRVKANPPQNRNWPLIMKLT